MLYNTAANAYINFKNGLVLLLDWLKNDRLVSMTSVRRRTFLLVKCIRIGVGL